MKLINAKREVNKLVAETHPALWRKLKKELYVDLLQKFLDGTPLHGRPKDLFEINDCWNMSSEIRICDESQGDHGYLVGIPESLALGKGWVSYIGYMQYRLYPEVVKQYISDVKRDIDRWNKEISSADYQYTLVLRVGKAAAIRQLKLEGRSRKYVASIMDK